MEGGGPKTDAKGNVTYPLRDLMYYYGGDAPMNVPGGWTPQTPPGRPASEVLGFSEGEARQPVYPIAQTPLYPSGLLSPEGELPEGPEVPVDPVDPVVDPNDPITPDSYGGLLANYAQRMGTSPTHGGYMYRATGEPYKVSGYKTGSDTYDTYRLPLEVYRRGEGDPYEAYATRISSPGGWDPSMNQWVTRATSNLAPFNINFADWTGTPGAYVGTEREARHPVLGGLLADPQNTRVQDPTSNVWTENIPWAHADYGGESWMTQPQASAFGTGSLANWGFKPMYGWDTTEQVSTTPNLLGFGGPEYRSSWVDPSIPWGPNHPDWAGPDIK